MGISLQDQLLKAGLVDKKKANQVRKEKQKQSKQRVKKGQPKPVDEVTQSVQQAQRAQAERDRQLNLARKAEADQRALQAQIRQLVEMNQLSLEGGEIAYNFTDQRKVKTLHVSEQIQAKLGRGQLAIARFDDGYAVVPVAVAEKIRQRDDKTIVLLNETLAPADDDDPYAEFQVPDDLMW